MKICEAGRSSGCCRNPDIRTINTMGADTAGNFNIIAGAGVGVTTVTNGVIIAYTGGITTYTNTDGNLDIDNANFTIDLANDIVIAGDLTVNGTYYTVHAEHVYTEDDYIIMRDGAVTGLGSGDFSGFQVKLYDGVNDGRLVIDNSGTARVGDVGDEQPLLTREEAANLNNGALLKWDSANSKAVDEGTVGDDTHPVKIVNGVATAVTTALMPYASPTLLKNESGVKVYRWHQMVMVSLQGYNNNSTSAVTVFTDMPTAVAYSNSTIGDQNATADGFMWIEPPNVHNLIVRQKTVGNHWGEMIYITSDP